uniref:Nucleoside diphosphate kinase n=1 Tax=Rhizophora mucronata TaxID=61149 RepID=A0A2P2K5B5_RHIMU
MSDILMALWGSISVVFYFSIRAMCGIDTEQNCVHGSDSLQAAQREISFFFGDIHFGEAVEHHDEL